MRKLTAGNAERKPLKAAGLNADPSEDLELPYGLPEKMGLLQPFIKHSDDLICRRISINGWGLEAVIFFLEGAVDNEALHQSVIQPLLQVSKTGETCSSKILAELVKSTISVGQIKTEKYAYALLNAIFDGFTVVLVDSIQEAIVIDIRSGMMRSVEEPLLDKTLTGPREGFTESTVANVSLIRRKLRDPRLVVKKQVIGQRSRSTVITMYIEDIADPQIVQEVHSRISRIKIDAVLSSSYISQLIDDDPYTFFPLNRICERPDIVAADLLEGRVAILGDQSPQVVLYPALLVEMFQSAEDYYEKTTVSSLFRFLRFFAFMAAIFLPAAYIALLSFQPEMIPFGLLTSLARARKEVPFPVFIEAIVMEVIIQMIIEAGFRLPPSLSQTIGIVSGIILGQAAVLAKLASPTMIVVITLTTIANFCISNFNMAMAVRVVRIPMLILAAAFGTVGLSLGWFFLVVHLASLESMGIPYLAPLGPVRYKDIKDTFWRTFLWKMKDRPVSLSVQDLVRQGSSSEGEDSN